MKRRALLGAAAAGAAAALLPQARVGAQLKPGAGRLRQAVARWCFASIPIERLCEELVQLGVTGLDLVEPEEWPVCKRYGITPSIVHGGGGFRPAPAGSNRTFGPSFGWNDPANHEELLQSMRASIERAGAAGLPTIIGLFGDRAGRSDAEGIGHCVQGLRRIVPELERAGITLAIELLNSKVDHPDYQGDNTAFGVAVCQALGSERVKLVYDAYHMQIMEGNLISTLREHIRYFSHIHVAGVPGRHEIDETQEVNWRAVALAIADLGFTGFVAHEWTPTAKDPLESLRRAVALLTV
jgi:hydroxypyruvate isomerase